MDEIIIRAHDTKEKIVQTINESNMPAIILRPMIKEIYDQLERIEQEQYQTALANQEQKKAKKKEEK